jgi:hypothetical protein
MLFPNITNLSLMHMCMHTQRYPVFYKCLLQGRMLVCTYFSLNELHFCYSKQLTFISLATFTCKVHGHFILNLWVGFLPEDGDRVQSPKILF